RPVRGLEHSLCIFREVCGDIPVLEHNGDLFSCDHFVRDDHLLGNIRETRLTELLESPAQRRFGEAKRDSLPRYCRECDVLSMCNGGCPKDRIVRTPEGEEGLNYLCPGLKKFFTHSRPVFERLVPLWKAGAPAEDLMRAARRPDRRAPEPSHRADVGRNDPCPCGSGRKHKSCCLRG
ncbi:MAG: SPASM domain-containing protein, partial [Gemmatimonadetes bacterium]|nr:SPASM domain-containing protein [Gemmatimonadota bacterium]